MFLEKADKQFLLLKKDYAVTLQILFLRGISRWWKVIKIFPVSLSGNMAQLINFMGLLIFPFKWGGLSFPSSTVWKSRSCLYVNKHATCDFKISSPVTASLLRTCEHFGLRILRGLAFDFRFSVFGFRQKYKLVFKFFPVCLWSERQLNASRFRFCRRRQQHAPTVMRTLVDHKAQQNLFCFAFFSFPIILSGKEIYNGAFLHPAPAAHNWLDAEEVRYFKAIIREWNSSQDLLKRRCEHS